MKGNTVVFIIKREYDNLGTGYMSAVLHEAGYDSLALDIDEGNENILMMLKGINPLVVGFSVIYQYHIGKFIELARYLRRKGLSCHFTAGGHYATIRYEELFELMPELDSVVRCEGEYAIRELAGCLSSGAEWRTTQSIAYRSNGRIELSILRPLLKDLDALPWPQRSDLREYALGKRFATLAAGRGCTYDCSFCNLREFYLPHRGTVKRVRKPEKVVEEMEGLFRERDCSVFLFQDDDFPLLHEKGSLWAELFCNALEKSEMHGKVMWKINCRPDEIDEKMFARMKDNGLFLVFIGIEDGTDEGLKMMNKHLEVSQCVKGISILKKLGIGFDYGFMLFQPSTTFAVLNENLDFLRKICGDGYSPVTFLKMMPYYATRIERELIAEGRLKGDHGSRDYEFREIAMNRYYEFITDSFLEWTRYRNGVVNISKWARNYISVCSRYFELETVLPFISRDLSGIISRSNLFMLDTMKELAAVFESGRFDSSDRTRLAAYGRKIHSRHERYRRQINNSMFTLVSLIQGSSTVSEKR